MRKNNNLRLKKTIPLILLSFTLLPYSFTTFAIEPTKPYEQQNREEIAKTLQNLTQYEIDWSFLVSQCLENVNNQTLKDKLIKIKEECEDNIKVLSNLIRKYGREAPAHTRDFKGFFMQGYAAMRGALTDRGAMKALHTNSQAILKAFELALNSSLSIEIKEEIQKIYGKKKEDHRFIESQI